MAIFPHIEVEDIIQENDKLRIKADKSFVSKDEAAVTLVEIEPEAGNGFINVTGSSSRDWYLDWEYATEGTVTISCRVTTDGAPTTVTKQISVVSAATDKLFSNDQDLMVHEHDILSWVDKDSGRNSFLNVHRRSQELILAWLDEKGYVDTSGNKYTKAAFVNVDEAKEWSTFMTLRLIFEDLSNSVDDIFDLKSKKYKTHELNARNRAVLRIDTDGDGTVDKYEGHRIVSQRLVRR